MLKYYEMFKKVGENLKEIPLLGSRFILAYAFWITGMMKWNNIEGTAWWFGSLGIPFPLMNAYISATVEVLGCFLLILGLGTRIITIPLIIIMFVAIATVHASHGWLAIASGEWPEVAMRLGKAKDLLKEHGNYEWLTETGSFVVLNNGVEFVVTYIFMLMFLWALGPGKFSIDYFISNRKSK